MDLVSNLTEGGDGKITYLSASPFEIHHILCKLESAQRHPVFGELIFPDGMTGELVPCIVACHGSRGWADHHQDHINNWLGAGFAVFCINSFDSREVDRTVESQMMVTYAMMLSDAFEALKLLNTHPLIDSGKIAITGWSLGGTVALYSAWKPIAESLAQNGERFVAHMPFYPAAHLRPEDNRWQDVPIKIFHGEMDDYTPLSLVQGLIDEVNKIGVSMELEIYPNSHHSFDSKEEMQWLPNAIKLDERAVQISLEGEMWGEIEEGIKVPLNEPHERLAAFNLVKNVGAHVGGNSDARKRALQGGTEFLQHHLK